MWIQRAGQAVGGAGRVRPRGSGLGEDLGDTADAEDAERAVFADTHARVGVMPGWGLTVRLPKQEKHLPRQVTVKAS